METTDILKLAQDHGLNLEDEIDFNEMGIDFKVCFATDLAGGKWVLRIPRRGDLVEQIEMEKRILNVARKYLSTAVPDWKIASSTLIAYPLMENKPVLTFDPDTYEVSWNINREHSIYVASLAKVLVEIHQVPVEEARAFGLKVLNPEMAREEISDRVETVKRELGINEKLESRWRSWLDNDNLWPTFTTFIHGDLYAGHVLGTENGKISGIIDWSEGQVSDPSIDFSGHISVFGEESLKELVKEYERLGGTVWEKMFEQAVERHAAAPLAYGFFAIKTGRDQDIEAAKIQLGLQ